MFFLHALLPHIPFRFLPTGQEYLRAKPIPGRPFSQPSRWGSDEWLTIQGYQRHVLQTQLADRLIGTLLDRLQAEGLLRDSAIVVTADHGGGHEPGEFTRRADRRTLKEIAPVPLFIKAPGQTRGEISDVPAQTIDVVPTIADLLDVRVWPSADGISLLSDVPPDRDRELFTSDTTLRFGGERLDLDAVVDRKYRWLSPDGASIEPYTLAPADAWDLIGSASPTATVKAPGRIDLLDAAAYEDFDPQADPLPALMMGRYVDAPAGDRATIAVEVNGRIRTITRTYEDDGEVRFYAMLDPSWFEAGGDRLRFFLVADDGSLVRIPS
jgi:hypothetical protein